MAYIKAYIKDSRKKVDFAGNVEVGGVKVKGATEDRVPDLHTHLLSTLRSKGTTITFCVAVSKISAIFQNCHTLGMEHSRVPKLHMLHMYSLVKARISYIYSLAYY